MTRYLLDTNICVFYLRDKYDVWKYIDEKIGLHNCYISEITIAELKFGEELGRRKGVFKKDKYLDGFLSSINVLPISSAINLFAEEKARLQTNGIPCEDNFDLLIGCTAVANDMIMVTENVKDFKNINNIQLENWIKR